MKDKTKNNRTLIVIIGIAIVALILVIVFVAFQKKSSPTVSRKEGAEGSYVLKKTDNTTVTYENQTYQLNPDIQTVLFLGVDQTGEAIDYGYGNGLTGGRSDCIVLLIVNQKENTITTLNISRDTMVDTEVYGIGGGYITSSTMQLAMQYAFGEGTTQSCLLTKKAVSRLLIDTPITSYISLNMEGLETVVDSLGGISMTIPEDYSYIDPRFTQGSTVTFDGSLAERYIRYRDTSEDGSNNGRMIRQEQFVKAFVTKLKELRDLSSANLQTFLDAADPYMVTDMSIDDIKDLTKYSMTEDSYFLPGENVFGNGHDEFWVDDHALHEMILGLIYEPVEAN